MDILTLTQNLQQPNRKVDVVLDTDTYNEIDDRYAVAYLLDPGPFAEYTGFTEKEVEELCLLL